VDIAVDRTSQVPIYRQIERRIEEMILAGSLPAGFRLPPERRLAEALGVNRSTVLTAYRELKGAGLVDACVGRGTTVLPRQPQPAPASLSAGPGLPWTHLFREGAERSPDPLLRDLLSLSERPDVISLSIGLPAPELLPLDRLKHLLDELLREVGPALLLHCPTEGHTPLRETLSQWLATHGISCRTPELLVLSGSQQGLDLVARTLLDGGDLVVLEEPTYIGALQVFRSAGARTIGIPVDPDGMRTDLLEAVLERRRPKLIYTLPTFQNPSGTTMSLERRHHLLELAYRYQVPIIEDDPYSELRYDGEPLPSLKALDERGHVLYLSTFSKVLFPGMRIGFLVAPRTVIRQLVLAKQAIDLHSNSLGQYLLERFISEGFYEPYLSELRAAYRDRRDSMAAALTAGSCEGLLWSSPAGGFYFWCRLPDGVEQTQLLNRASESRVAYLPGWSCFSGEVSDPYARLNFSYPAADRIGEGVARFLDAVRQASRLGAAALETETATPPVV
jgi:DNA-binding transcriptional MocR family regulator